VASTADRTTLVSRVAAAIARCARWHGAVQVTLAAVDGRGVIRPMRTALRAAMAAEPAPQLI
jgi:hypothetical protein